MDWMEQFQLQNLTAQIIETNQKTERFGLFLSKEDAQIIVEERKNALREERRVEFGTGVISKIILEFCDSAYVNQDNYVGSLIRLQQIFYLFKNEMMDEITDDELLHFMKEQFEGICYGDFEYLEGTCLANFAKAIRAGYQGYKNTDGYGQYGEFDDVKRWDYDLYLEALKELF